MLVVIIHENDVLLITIYHQIDCIYNIITYFTTNKFK